MKQQGIKMKEEFCLSDKRNDCFTNYSVCEHSYNEKDVKEFIKLLKEEIYKEISFKHSDEWEKQDKIIDKLAGEKLL